MEEYKFKKNLTVHLSEDAKDELNEFISLTGREFKYDSEILRELMDAAFSRKTPKAVEKPENITKIKELTAEVKRLQSVKAVFTTDVNELKAANTELIGKTTNLQEINTELSANVKGLQNVNAELSENVNVVLNPFQKWLVKQYLANAEVKEWFRKNNLKGKKDGFCDLIDTEDENLNTVNLLLNAFVYSAAGSHLIPVVSITKIQETFLKYRKQNKEKSS